MPPVRGVGWPPRAQPPHPAQTAAHARARSQRVAGSGDDPLAGGATEALALLQPPARAGGGGAEEEEEEAEMEE